MELYQINSISPKTKQTLVGTLSVKFFTSEEECIKRAEEIASAYKKQGFNVTITSYDGFDWMLYKVVERKRITSKTNK